MQIPFHYEHDAFFNAEFHSYILGGKGDPFGIEQEIKISPYYQIVYVQTSIHPSEWDA